MARQLPEYNPFEIRSVDPLGLGLRVIGDQYNPMEDYANFVKQQYEAQKTEALNKQLSEQEAIAQKIQERTKAGGSYEDILAQAEKEYLAGGDLESALKTAKLKSELGGNPLSQAKELADLYKAAQEISAVDPSLGLSVVNQSRAGLNLPPMTSMPDQGELRNVAGVGVIRLRRDGSYTVVVPEQRSARPDYLEPGQAFRAMIDQETLGPEQGRLAYQHYSPALQDVFRGQYGGSPVAANSNSRSISADQAIQLGYNASEIAALRRQGAVR